jgi:hypothetical protein
MKEQVRNKGIVISGIIGIVLTVMFSILLISEFVRIGIIGDPAEINRYFFGSETMMDHGGWKYKSSSIYAWTSLVEGLLVLSISSIFIMAVVQNKKSFVNIGFFILVLWLIARLAGGFFSLPY